MRNLNLSEIPSSVYRLQLNEAFPLPQAIKVLPYLKDLGVEGVYCSPFYDAYSSHGYDVTDPNQLNPKLGSLQDYHNFCDELKRLGLKQIIDVVPNHMGMKGGKNRWWQDVLEKGPKSKYAAFFDINWNPEKQELHNRVLLPILGTSYGKALENKEIQLSYTEGNFQLHYGDYPLPVSKKSLPLILGEATNIEKRVAEINGKKGVSRSFDTLDQILEAQHYRLAYWKVASHEINYRRFFNIHELVALRIEEERVLDEHHKWIFDLVKEGKVQGLRIDHPDGLYDPVCYFERLQSHYPIYTVVEKILDRKEQLPENWDVEGTVGYESINLINGLFIRQEHEGEFSEIYESFLGEELEFDELVYASKKLFATYEMVSEVEALGLTLDRLSEESRDFRDFTRHDLTRALSEVIATFPVYRTYIAPKGKARVRDTRYITQAISLAKERAQDLDPSIFDFLEELLLVKMKAKQEEYRDFVLRFQQLTGPMMAKGLEDTTFYRYNRFISLNEVGGDPPHFGCSVSDFHKFNQEKLKMWPYGFIASSTHDTKRSEDVRMRLNVLSEIPHRWRIEVKKWARVAQGFKKEGPSPNLEYFIYQTLVGVWPREGVKKKEMEAFANRLWEVILKSMREAKHETSWMFPNLPYEEGVRHFLFSLLSSEKENPFLKHFLPFQKEIDRLGTWNSYVAVLLKCAACGVVDLYQGNEIFNYCLVDPDNRKPVDFEVRKKLLAKAHLSDDPNVLKCFLHKRALHFRKEHKELFLQGEYIPLRVRGTHSERVVAFLRRTEKKQLIVITGRFFAGHAFAWGDTEVILPKEIKTQKWTDLFTEKERPVKQRIKVADVLDKLPVSFLYD